MENWLFILIPAGLIAFAIIGVLARSSSVNNNLSALKDAGFHEDDRVESPLGDLILFDNKNKKIGLATKKYQAIVPYSEIREFSYSSGHQGAPHRFRIATRDPKNPLYTIEIQGRDNEIPELWMAKFSIHLKSERLF